MATINNTDTFLVNRSGTSYSLQAQSLLDDLQDGDLMLVNRAGKSYKATGAEIKSSIGSGSIDTPTIIAPTSDLGVGDPDNAPDPDTLEFVGSIPSGKNITEWGEARWEVSDDDFATVMTDFVEIIDPSATQVLTFEDRSNIRLEPNIAYKVRLSYTARDPVVDSNKTNSVAFETGEAANGWEPIAGPVGSYTRKIIYGEPGGTPTYVLAGNDSVWSHDLINWTQITLDMENSKANMMGGAYGNNMFMMTGTGSRNQQSSSDGITWTSKTVGNYTGTWDIAYGAGTWVVNYNGGSNAVRYSTDDGSTWTDVPNNQTGSQQFQNLRYDGSKFILLNKKQVRTSVTGAINTWNTYKAFPGTDDPRSFTFDDSSNYVSVANNQICKSTDGLNWTVVGPPQDSASWNSVAYGNGLFVAVSPSGPARVMYSEDKGDTWISTPAPELGLTDITFAQDQFIAISTNGDVLVSKSGIGRPAMTSVKQQRQQVQELETSIAAFRTSVSRLRAQLSLPETAEIPQAIDGYFPLYVSEVESDLASANGESHSHDIDGVTYYMPDSGVTLYHGNYSEATSASA